MRTKHFQSSTPSKGQCISLREMAADFIGVIVLVTLNDPPNAKIRGLVTNAVEQKLTLGDGI